METLDFVLIEGGLWDGWGKKKKKSNSQRHRDPSQTVIINLTQKEPRSLRTGNEMASELMNITEDKLFPFGGIKLKHVNKRTSEPRLGFKPLAFFHNWSMLYLIGLHMLAFTTKKTV